MPLKAATLWSVRNISLLLASTMTVMAGATLAPSLPLMQEAFHNEYNIELWVKLILTIPALFIILAAPLIGKLLDSNHKKPILLSALCAYGLFGSAGYFYHESLIFILCSRALLGIAVAAIMVSCITLAGQYFTGPRLGQYMGFQAAFGSFGGVVFLAGAGLAAEIHWTAPFLIYSVAFALVPLCAYFLNEPKNTSQHITQDEKPSTPSEPPNTSKRFALCCMLATLEVAVLYLVPLHFPFYAIEFGVTSAATVGFSIAAMLLASSLVSLNFRIIHERLTHVNIHATGLFIVFVGYSCLGLANSYWLAVIGLLLIGTGLGVIRPNVIVWLFSFTPIQRRGAVSGKLTSFFFIGQILCPFLTQPLISKIGHANTYLWVAGLTLGVSLLMLILYRQKN